MIAARGPVCQCESQWLGAAEAFASTSEEIDLLQASWWEVEASEEKQKTSLEKAPTAGQVAEVAAEEAAWRLWAL